jgi:hypothetical protein
MGEKMTAQRKPEPTTFYGQPIADMTRDELLNIIRYLIEDNNRLRIDAGQPLKVHAK